MGHGGTNLTNASFPLSSGYSGRQVGIDLTMFSNYRQQYGFALSEQARANWKIANYPKNIFFGTYDAWADKHPPWNNVSFRTKGPGQWESDVARAYNGTYGPNGAIGYERLFRLYPPMRPF